MHLAPRCYRTASHKSNKAERSIPQFRILSFTVTLHLDVDVLAVLTSVTDSVKKAARREAWYSQDDSTGGSFNIFGRMDTRLRRHRDVESGLQGTQTENDAYTPIAKTRRKSHETEGNEFLGPRKAGTFPIGPVGNSEDSKPPQARPSLHTDGKVPSTPEVVQSVASETHRIDPGPPERTPTGTSQSGFAARLAMILGEAQQSLKAIDPKWPGKQHLKDMREKYGPPPPVGSQVKAILYAWINLLLAFVPTGFAVNYLHFSPVAVFVLNFLAILPCNTMLSFGIEEVNLYVGDRMAGLLSMTTR